MPQKDWKEIKITISKKIGLMSKKIFKEITVVNVNKKMQCIKKFG